MKKRKNTPLDFTYMMSLEPRNLLGQKNSKKTIRWPSKRPKTKNVNKRKQTPQRLLVSKNWNTYWTKKWVFYLFYISWKFHPCRSNHYWVREFSNFLQNDVKMAILGTQIIRSPVAWEPDHIERLLIALWDPLMTLRLGQHDFKIPWKFLWNGLFNNKVSVILKRVYLIIRFWLLLSHFVKKQEDWICFSIYYMLYIFLRCKFV